jgi:trans-2,3-dihydro-3-hydroxyanthranilate isomerase
VPSRPYYVLDVFTDEALAGNALAVVMEAEDLSSDRMQAIAREFSLSETVFLLPPGSDDNLARLRIFTPGRELPFAGHPTIGTAVLLAHLEGGGLGTDSHFVLEEEVGAVPCSVRLGTPSRATFALPALPVEAGLPPSDAELAEILGLTTSEIGYGSHRPSRWGAPNPFTFVPVSGIDAVRRCRIDSAKANEVLGALGSVQIYVYSRETVDAGATVHCRMFAPGLGIPEDPATGSAAASFAGAWNAFEELPDGEHSVLIEQGFEMGRPSRIELGITTAQGRIVSGTISGAALVVAEGTLYV